MAELDARFLDRFFELHVSGAMRIAVDGALKRVPVRSDEGLVIARQRLDRACASLELHRRGAEPGPISALKTLAMLPWCRASLRPTPRGARPCLPTAS